MLASGIYKITNLVNGDFYIGSSVDVKKRIKSHKNLLEKGTNPCLYLQRSYNKYKGYNFIFEQLLCCEKEDLLEYEQYFIDKLVPKYNICKKAGNNLGTKKSAKALYNQFQAQRKFSDEEVIKMFNMKNLGYKTKDIANEIGCKPNNVSSILTKDNKYKIVKEKYGLVLLNKKVIYKGRYEVTCPKGIVKVVSNLTKYCKKVKVDPSGLIRVSNGIYKQYKGYYVRKLD
jgi:hypothetical protein